MHVGMAVIFQGTGDNDTSRTAEVQPNIHTESRHTRSPP